MVDLPNLSSVFEIGFAIHVAVPLLGISRGRALRERVDRLRAEILAQFPDVNRSEPFFQAAESWSERNLSGFLRLVGFVGFVVAIYSVSVLVVAGIFPNWARVSEWQALLLVLITLLPVPLLTGLLEAYSAYVVSGLMAQHAKMISELRKKQR